MRGEIVQVRLPTTFCPGAFTTDPATPGKLEPATDLPENLRCLVLHGPPKEVQLIGEIVIEANQIFTGIVQLGIACNILAAAAVRRKLIKQVG